MNLSLTRKIERTVTAYLRGVINDPSLNIYPGHDREDGQGNAALLDEDGDVQPVKYPALFVRSTDNRQRQDMPVETGIREIDVRLRFAVDSTIEPDEFRARLDAWREVAECAMVDGGYLDYANEDGAPDTRPIIDLHVYHVAQTSEPSEQDGTDWIEDFGYTILCQNYDDLTG
jgi:hypothetical protein